MVETDELLQALGIVESHPDFRVLRRLVPRQRYREMDDTPIFRAAYLDCETTGLDTKTAEIIELAIARFTFDANGVIYEVEDLYFGFQQPSAPLSDETIEVTGITDQDVYGQQLDQSSIGRVMSGVDVVIAHNASYDRRIAELRLPGNGFDTARWACSFKQVPWKLYGALDSKLANIVHAAGLFFEGHRAMADVRAAIHVLATMTRPGEGRVSPMRDLLDSLHGTYRVLADESPFEAKDQLKSRGYRWEGEKPWFIDKPTKEAAIEEARWLNEQNLAQPSIAKINARDRYSSREDDLTFSARRYARKT